MIIDINNPNTINTDTRHIPRPRGVVVVFLFSEGAIRNKRKTIIINITIHKTPISIVLLMLSIEFVFYFFKETAHEKNVVLGRDKSGISQFDPAEISKFFPDKLAYGFSDPFIRPPGNI